MGVIEDMARNDWQRFSEETTLELCAPSGERAVFKGIGTRNFIGVTLTDGQEAVAPNVHVAFSEKKLLEANLTYPVRDENGEIKIKGHRVSFKDANGVLQDYAFFIIYPDQTTGMIMADCELWKPITND